MESKFDAYTYFERIFAENKLAKESGFVMARAIGMNEMQEAVAKNKNSTCIFVVDDTNDGTTLRRGDSFMDQRGVFVSILIKYAVNDLSSQRAALLKARALYRQIISRVIRDFEAMRRQGISLQENIEYFEFQKGIADNCCGRMFQIVVEEYRDLSYKEDEFSA